MSNLKVSILAPLAFFIIVIAGGFSVGLYTWQETRDTQMLDKIDGDLSAIFDRLVADEVATMKATLHVISRNETLASRFLARDRMGLLAESAPLLKNLRSNYKITHFYFTDPARTNFLRVHQPARFGDTIERTTMMMSERDGDVSAGLELGALGTFTLRVVMPWKVDGRLIGYLELGSEIDHLVTDASDFLNMKLHVFVPKKDLVRRDWEIGMTMLGLSKNWDQLQDYVVLEADPIPAPLIQHVNRGGLKTGGVVKDVKWGERIISLLHKPITNAAGEKDVALVAIHDETVLDNRRTTFILWTVLGSTAIGIGLFTLFWLILSKVERDIRRYEKNLIQAKEEAESSSKAKTDFLATMSHELRTPLNAILGFSEIMQMQAFGPLGSDKYAEYANDIHFSGAHLLSLINDILHISKIEAGRHDLHMEYFDVPEFIGECLIVVNDRAAEMGLALSNTITDDVPHLFADRRAVQQCVLNLLSNATKFTPKGGTVTLSHRTTDKWFDLIVTDTGIGIADADLPTILQPFTQVERTKTARFHEGTGLGLTITRNLIEMHGGKLLFKSEVGVGTQATIRLPRGPLAQDDAAKAPC